MKTVVLALCAPGTVADRLSAHPNVIGSHPAANEVRADEDMRSARYLANGHGLVLLGIGADGCAALARRVEADGLDGVTAII